MRSPGAIIDVVNMPENAPAANSCACVNCLASVCVNKTIFKKFHTKSKNYIFVWCFLLQSFAQTKTEETDREYWSDASNWCRHAFVKATETFTLHSLFRTIIRARIKWRRSIYWQWHCLQTYLKPKWEIECIKMEHIVSTKGSQSQGSNRTTLKMLHNGIENLL